jgi:hypothetical protein
MPFSVMEKREDAYLLPCACVSPAFGLLTAYISTQECALQYYTVGALWVVWKSASQEKFKPLGLHSLGARRRTGACCQIFIGFNAQSVHLKPHSRISKVVQEYGYLAQHGPYLPKSREHRKAKKLSSLSGQKQFTVPACLGKDYNHVQLVSIRPGCYHLYDQHPDLSRYQLALTDHVLNLFD